MAGILKGGPFDNCPVMGPLAADKRTLVVHAESGDKAVYTDTGEIEPETGQRIFAYQPPKPTPASHSGGITTQDAAHGL